MNLADWLENLPNWVDYEVYGNLLVTWIIAAGLFVLASVVFFLLRRIACSRLSRLQPAHGRESLDVTVHLVRKTRGWFLLLMSLFVSSRLLELPESFDDFTITVAIIALVVQLGIWMSAALVRVIELKREEELEDNPAAVAAIDISSFLLQVAIWSVVLLLVLDNVGVNVTGLVAGLGVGGIAVALAAQNILGDLFASLSIVLDKPFVVGDFLNIGEFNGTVEKVGIKTTRMRSLSGEQLIFSNNDLLSSRIRNYGRMHVRRVVFSIGVTYQTRSEQLRKLPEMLQTAVEAQENTRFDRAHFKTYGDFALLFETVYYVTTGDYTTYMDVQQAVNLRLFEDMEAAGIEFAYPTQTLLLHREGETNNDVKQ